MTFVNVAKQSLVTTVELPLSATVDPYTAAADVVLTVLDTIKRFDIEEGIDLDNLFTNFSCLAPGCLVGRSLSQAIIINTQQIAEKLESIYNSLPKSRKTKKPTIKETDIVTIGLSINSTTYRLFAYRTGSVSEALADPNSTFFELKVETVKAA